MIRAAGAQFVLTSNHGDYDPATSEVDPREKTSIGAAFRDTYSVRDTDGAAITEKDVKLIVSAILDNREEMPEPRSGDQVRFAGASFTVVNCKPWNYNGVGVGFEVQARSA